MAKHASGEFVRSFMTYETFRSGRGLDARCDDDRAGSLAEVLKPLGMSTSSFRRLKASMPGVRLGVDDVEALFCATVLSYLTAEIIETARGASRARGASITTSRDVELCIINDAELKRMMKKHHII
jgi:hypothetical protein